MYYQHSGRYSLGGLLLGLATGCFFGFILAWAYGVGIILVPEVHLAAFATLTFGGLIGLATGGGLMWGHVRNNKATIAIAAIAATLSLYLSWAAWIQSIFLRTGHKRVSWLALVKHPAAVWYLMKWINHYGTWTIDNGQPTKGWALWLVWGLEAALVIGISAAAAYALLLHSPFCETCSQWCRQNVRVLLAPLENPQQLKLQLESKDLRSLEALGPGPKTADHLAVTSYSCDRCSQFHTLSVSQTTFHKRKFGQARVSSANIVQHLIVGPGEAQALRQISERVAQASKLKPEKARGAAAG